MQNSRTFLVLLPLLSFLSTGTIAQTTDSSIKSSRSMKEVFNHLGDPSYNWPEIHSSTYCSQLSDNDSTACSAGIKEGKAIYQALSDYHAKLPRMSTSEFSKDIASLAQLRDRLWKKGIYGDLLLANLIDKIIFWRLVERISSAPQKELPQMSKLLIHYRAVSKDWSTVVRAIEIEQSKELDKRNLKNNQDLGSIYLEMLEQVHPQDRDGINLGTADFIMALDKLDVEEFVSTFLQSPPRSKALFYFCQLRQKVGIFPPLSGQNVFIENTKEFPIVTNNMSRKFQEWFPKYIPSAQREREFGMTENLHWEDLFDLFQIGKTLNSDPKLPLDLVYF